MDEENKIEFFDPATIMFFIMGFVSDVSFLGILGLAIPGVGLAIAMFVLAAHYFFGLVILFYFWGKTRGWLPKLWLLLAWIVPLPSLTSSIVAAILLSNKVVAMVVEQVAIQVVAAATAGAGEALEAGASPRKEPKWQPLARRRQERLLREREQSAKPVERRLREGRRAQKRELRAPRERGKRKKILI